MVTVRSYSQEEKKKKSLVKKKKNHMECKAVSVIYSM